MAELDPPTPKATPSMPPSTEVDQPPTPAEAMRADAPSPDGATDVEPPAAPESEVVAPAVEGTPGEDPLAAAWAKVEAAFDDAEAHRKFLAIATALDRLPEAGQRYRAVRDVGDDRAALAKARIDELLGIAMGRMTVTRTEPTPTRSRIEWIALGVTLVLLGAAAYAMLRTQ